MTEEVIKTLENFRELIELKSISLENNIEENVILKNDITLIKILLNNLIQNSIRHNHEGGKVKIELSSEKLKIQNTGDELNIPVEQLFERFKKGHQSEKNTGLGLSIVKMICDVSNYEVTYVNEKNSHIIIVEFKKSQLA
jgi:signal transduction histidine kinase